MNTTPYLSVVIPTYRRRAAVERALRALARQTLAPDEYEVIVVIDGSEDGTRELVAGFSAPFALRGIWQPNQGRAAACNAGILAATGALIVLLDDDTELSPECLAGHRQAHADGSRLGVMGAAPIRLDAFSPPVVHYIGSKFNRHLDTLTQTGQPVTLRDFYTDNFSIRRDILLEVGLFDEAFKTYGNEDVELCLRLAQSGVRIVYSPSALAYQHYEKNFTQLAQDNIAKGRTAVLLARKHPQAFPELRLSTYTQTSRKWRALRAGLLGLSRLWTRTPDVAIRAMCWLEQRQPARMDLYYSLALDYFFWLGARAALREDHRTSSLSSLAKLAGKAPS